MGFRMACPKCGSTNLTAERDGGSYVRGGAVMVKCYMCGKMLYGEQVIEAEYKKQLREWKASQTEKDQLERVRTEKIAARKKAEADARARRDEDDRIKLAEAARRQQEADKQRRIDDEQRLKQEKEQSLRRAREKAARETARHEAAEAERRADAARLVEEQRLEAQRQQEEALRKLAEEKRRKAEAEARLVAEKAKREEEARLQELARKQREEEARRMKVAAELERKRDLERTQRELDIAAAAQTALNTAEGALQDLDTQIRTLQGEKQKVALEIQRLQVLHKKANNIVLRRKHREQMAALRNGNPPPRIQCVCDWCDEPFEKLPGDAKKNKSGHFFCSVDHMNLWRKQQSYPKPMQEELPKLIAKPVPPRGKVAMSCAHCNCPVYRTPLEVRKSKTGNFFCSPQHHQAWLKEHPDVFRDMAHKQAAIRREAASTSSVASEVHP